MAQQVQIDLIGGIMTILKLFCFILACDGLIYYIADVVDSIDSAKTTRIKVARALGLSIGIAARVFTLYGAATCWVFA